MRENTSPHFSSLAADESLEYAREAENLDAAIEHLYRTDPGNRAAIGRANARLGVVLKLAEVHSNLAQAEQLIGLRVDLAPLVADLTAVPDAADAARTVHLR